MCRANKLLRILSATILVSVFVFAATVLPATVPQTTEQLVGNSSDVVRGNVLSQKSQWDSSHQLIYTEIIVEVSDVIIGSIEKGRSISIFVPGGEVGDTGLAVEHTPQFDDGEDVVLFLTEVQGMYGVTSWEMGKFSIQDGNVENKDLPVNAFIEEIKAVKR